MPSRELVLQTASVSHGMVLIEAPLGGGKTYAGLAFAELLSRRGRCNRFLVVAPSRGTASAMFGRLAALHDAQKQVRGIQEKLAGLGNAVDLLSTSEKDNSLPAITSSLILCDGDLSAIQRRLGLGAWDLVEVLGRLLQAIERPVLQLLRALDLLLGVRHFDTAAPPPRHAMSPCGVIRFAAPLVPRAPGPLVGPQTSSAFGVLTA